MSGSVPPRVLKTCACGARYDEEGWEQLRLLGHVGDPAYGRDSVFELRQCTCRSSLALHLDHPPAK